MDDAESLAAREAAHRAPCGPRGALQALWRRVKRLRLSDYTRSAKTAQRWLDKSGGALDGVVGKRLDEPYRSGERAMIKIKKRRTADCVVGGFRYGMDIARGRLLAPRLI